MNDYPAGTDHQKHELFDVLGPPSQGPLVELHLHITPALRADPWLSAELHLAISEILIHHQGAPRTDASTTERRRT